MDNLKEGSWIEFDGYSKNGKAYTAKQLKVVDELAALGDDLNDSKPAKSAISDATVNNLSAQIRDGGMVRVRAVNDAMQDKEMPFWDKVAYVNQAVNLYSASTMTESEANAEYDDQGQRIPF